MIKTILIIIINTFLFIPEIFSQDSTSKFIITDIKNKNDSALSPFLQEQSEWFRNPEVPSFVFQGPGGKFSLGIGGFINLTSSYDFDGIVNDLDFLTYNIVCLLYNSDAAAEPLCVDLGGLRIIKKKKTKNTNKHTTIKH